MTYLIWIGKRVKSLIEEIRNFEWSIMGPELALVRVRQMSLVELQAYRTILGSGVSCLEPGSRVPAHRKMVEKEITRRVG